MKNVYKVFVLVNPSNEIFVDFTEDGFYTVEPCNISRISEIWAEYTKTKLETLVNVYDRLKDFRVAEIEVTETFEFKEV